MISSKILRITILFIVSVSIIGIIYYSTLMDGATFVLNKVNLKNYVTDHVDNVIESVDPFCNCRTIWLTDSSPFRWCSDEAFLRGDGQKVLSYCLFGNASDSNTFRRYYSLLKNISLTADQYYPSWSIRIYHDITKTDKKAHDLLCSIYCQFPHVDLCSVEDMRKRLGNRSDPINPSLLKGLNPRMYRLLVMLDPQVDLFVSRDVDSVIWIREVDAVREWLQSNYTFHVMRDHIHHIDLVLTGMFGVKLNRRRDLVQGLVRAMIHNGQDSKKGTDQNLLANIFWPAAKYDVMAHDSYQCENPAVVAKSVLKQIPFPTQRNGNIFVGGVGPTLQPPVCPVACRPPDHKDWKYC